MSLAHATHFVARQQWQPAVVILSCTVLIFASQALALNRFHSWVATLAFILEEM
jgi:hypothetical protein